MRFATLAHIVGGGPVWPLWITRALLFNSAVAGIGPLATAPSCG